MPPDPPSLGPSHHDIALLTRPPKLKSVPPPLVCVRICVYTYIRRDLSYCGQVHTKIVMQSP